MGLRLNKLAFEWESLQMDQEYFITLARYNRWANKRIFAACEQLSEDDYRKQRDGVFLSIHLTLNHILLIDRIWMCRLRDKKIKIDTLRKELHSSRDALRIARKMRDDKIILAVERMKKRHLQRTLDYVDRRGEAHSTPMPYVLAHMFNHATHHRGQVHDMLSETDVPPPTVDLIDFVRWEQKKKKKSKKKGASK